MVTEIMFVPSSRSPYRYRQLSRGRSHHHPTTNENVGILRWVFPAVLAEFADEEAQLEVERYDEVDELHTKEDKGCVRQLYRKKWWKMD